MELPYDNSLSAGVSTSSRIMGSFPLLQMIGCIAQPLSRTSFPRSQLFLSKPATGHSLTASARRDPTNPSSALLAPHISSPCPGANGEINPLEIGSSEWLTLWLPRTN